MTRAPIMSKTGGSGGGDYEQPKARPTVAVIGIIEPIGWQDSPEYGPKDCVCLVWELDQRMTDGRRFTIHASFTNSIGEKANLRKIVDALDPGQIPEDDDACEYDLRRLEGKSALVSLKAVGKKGRVVVASVMELPEGMQPIRPMLDYSKPFGLWGWFQKNQMDESRAMALVKARKERKAVEAGEDIPADDDPAMRDPEGHQPGDG